MDLILETKHLIIRELKESDAEAMFKMDSNPNVHKYLWNKPTQNISETIDVIKMVRQQYLDNKIGRFATILKETNEFIGWTGLKYNTVEVNNQNHFYDIGYRLDEKFWGKGYASEASFEWMRYSKEVMKIKRMCAAAHSDNIASNKILEEIGLNFKEVYSEDGILWNWYES